MLTQRQRTLVKTTQYIHVFCRQASGDSRLLNPVALVENHPACRKNDRGWGILPNQQAWKPHLVLLLLSSKLLSETDSLLKIQQNTGAAASNQQAHALRMLLGGAGRKMPPIPYLIASFIQKKSVSPSSIKAVAQHAAKYDACVDVASCRQLQSASDLSGSAHFC